MKKDANNLQSSSELLYEARNLNKCTHDCLIKIVGICYADNCLNAILMEYMNAGDLITYLRRPESSVVRK